MELTPQDIEEFKTAYKEAFGEDITHVEAREMAQRVVWLYELLMAGTTESLDQDSPNNASTSLTVGPLLK